jgi:hypothetical protein
MNDKLSRRAFGRFVVGAGVGVAGGALLVACGKSEPATPALSCTDTSSLDEAGVTTRIDNEYVDHTPIKDKPCSACAQYEPAPAGSCGGCKVVKGPINPDGYCKVWVAKPA